LFEAATPWTPTSQSGSPSPPLFGGMQANDRLWHSTSNRLAHVNEHFAQGREHVYFG
jgi:hypothetical protein